MPPLRQNTFSIVPNAPPDPFQVAAAGAAGPAALPAAKPPMTTKQARKLYNQQTRAPRRTKAEQRAWEKQEQERIRKELDAEKAASRARAARERKKSKEEAVRNERKKQGLPLVNVRPSQDTISRFLFRGKRSRETTEEAEDSAGPCVGSGSDKENCCPGSGDKRRRLNAAAGEQDEASGANEAPDPMLNPAKPDTSINKPPTPMLKPVEAADEDAGSNINTDACCAVKSHAIPTDNGTLPCVAWISKSPSTHDPSPNKPPEAPIAISRKCGSPPPMNEQESQTEPEPEFTPRREPMPELEPAPEPKTAPKNDPAPEAETLSKPQLELRPEISLEPRARAQPAPQGSNGVPLDNMADAGLALLDALPEDLLEELILTPEEVETPTPVLRTPNPPPVASFPTNAVRPLNHINPGHDAREKPAPHTVHAVRQTGPIDKLAPPRPSHKNPPGINTPSAAPPTETIRAAPRSMAPPPVPKPQAPPKPFATNIKKNAPGTTRTSKPSVAKPQAQKVAVSEPALPPTSTQLFLLDNFDDIMPSLSQEEKELCRNERRDAETIAPPPPPPRRSLFAKPRTFQPPPRPPFERRVVPPRKFAPPPSLVVQQAQRTPAVFLPMDTSLDFLSTQDLMSTQDVHEVEKTVPHKRGQATEPSVSNSRLFKRPAPFAPRRSDSTSRPTTHNVPPHPPAAKDTNPARKDKSLVREAKKARPADSIKKPPVSSSTGSAQGRPHRPQGRPSQPRNPVQTTEALFDSHESSFDRGRGRASHPTGPHGTTHVDTDPFSAHEAYESTASHMRQQAPEPQRAPQPTIPNGGGANSTKQAATARLNPRASGSSTDSDAPDSQGRPRYFTSSATRVKINLAKMESMRTFQVEERERQRQRAREEAAAKREEISGRAGDAEGVDEMRIYGCKPSQDPSRKDGGQKGGVAGAVAAPGQQPHFNSRREPAGWINTAYGHIPRGGGQLSSTQETDYGDTDLGDIFALFET
ncbi:hypothetical protein MAPG_11671 [Magnaporthiopsis poae ATCC 64411]|uniref:Uncharacterized protein n=1 Tax=Magnaporthiopsis poae (strain ATCC 64411 / 73-15) TaxID=644358 RepID=A0A0C4EFW3_MAGP6|nr:hypothetical protein MAPG_11671 [Magnaporthiopsis poae ATCC 64411]